jgi:adhesin/invasin
VKQALRFPPAVGATTPEKRMRSIRLAQHAAAATLLGAVLLAGCSNAIDQGPGGPTKITSTGATDLSGVVGTDIGPYVFVVTDADGNVVPNVKVDFTITGAGTLNTTTATTDNGGSVIATAKFGHTVGTMTVTATAVGVATPASVSSTSVADAPTQLSVLSGNNQSAASGTRLDVALGAIVTDQYGNPVNNIEVVWTAESGTLGSQNGRTDMAGRQTTSYTLPSKPGVNDITASTTFATIHFTETGN